MATLRQPPPKRRLPAAMQKPNVKAPPKRPSGPSSNSKTAAPVRRRPAPQRGRSSGTSPYLVLLMGFVVMAFLFALPTVPILLLGMIPAGVAVLVDRTPGKTAAICVAGLNFAGVAPFIAALWKGPNTLGHSIAIMTDIYSWLGMYGAAAAGWLLFLALPPMVASFLKIHAAQRVSTLRAAQARLKAEWGVGAKPEAGPPS